MNKDDWINLSIWLVLIAMAMIGCYAILALLNLLWWSFVVSMIGGWAMGMIIAIFWLG